MCALSLLALGQTHDAFQDVLRVKNSPDSSSAQGLNAFFDLGSWMGFSLPEDTNSTGFSGPYLLGLEHGVWASNDFCNVDLLDGDGGSILNRIKSSEQTYWPGRLTNELTYSNLDVSSGLIFQSKERVLISTQIINTSAETLCFMPVWEGSLFSDVGTFINGQDHVSVALDKTQYIYLSPLNVEVSEIRMSENKYKISCGQAILDSGDSITIQLEVQYHPESSKKLAPLETNELTTAIDSNTNRWERYLNIVHKDLTFDEKVVVVKSVCTLINNWRSAAGALKHDGIFPSYHYKWFQGFWSWDSWKHAAAMAKINPELAKNQVRAMYDYQNNEGMIADCIFRDTTLEQHNWRDTKPPLSSWCIWEIFKETKDSEFLQEMYPKLVKYHKWWYAYRDYDNDGLCEYGSNDGSLIAAKWESGMDNAIRFDHCFIVDGSNYSINTESVDLNAYLAKEKGTISKIAEVLGYSESKKWKEESDLLAARVRTEFYDEQVGFFFDIDAENGRFLNDALGPEGWTPLWCEIATAEQSRAVMAHMLDTRKFNTNVPLPTIDVSHRAFDPLNGYWRGPVWLDQVWFGIDGLKKYGYKKEAIHLTHKLIMNCEGLIVPGEAIRENYHPLSGKGLNAAHFSWSAAHLIMLLDQE